MDTYIENEAGWGRPINQSIGPVHWWTPFNNRACDPESKTMNFMGERIKDSALMIKEVICFDCLLKVLEAGKILGTPSTVTINMRVQVFGSPG
jgi:hypothetical protein